MSEVTYAVDKTIIEALNLLQAGLINKDQARQGLPQEVKDRYGIGD